MRHNVIGKRFNKFIIIGDIPKEKAKERFVLVRCDCGTEKSIKYSSLWSTKSCG